MLIFALRFSLSLCAAMVLAIVCFASNSLAQDIPEIAEKQKSVVLFDIRIKNIMEDAKKIGFDTKDFGNAEMPPPFNTIQPVDVSRVFGAASLPQSMADAMRGVGGPESPFEFFVRVQFKDADALEKFENEFKRNSKTTEIGDKEYYTAGEFVAPNVIAHRVDETSFEFGTLTYCQQPKRAFFTDRLHAAYKSAPNHPVRIAMDLETPAPLLAELVALGKQQLEDPISSAYLDLIDNADSLVITHSITAQDLLTVIVEGKDDAQAEELAGGIDSLLGTAKLAAGPMMMQMEQSDPEMKEAMAFLPPMLESLATARDKKTVKLLVAKPEGFHESIGKLQTLVRAKSIETQKLNNFRQVGLSVLNYESANRRFPFLKAGTWHENFSWRARVLPFLEEVQIYDQLNFEKSPAEQPNSSFAEKMPSFFGADGRLANVAWIESNVESFAMIRDGSANTIMLIENPKAQPWLEQNPLTIDQAIKLVKDLPDGEKLVVTMYDCSTRFISNSVDEVTLRSLFDPDDGQTVNDW